MDFVDEQHVARIEIGQERGQIAGCGVVAVFDQRRHRRIRRDQAHPAAGRRLHQRHPQLNPQQLDELNEACQGAMKFGHATAYELAQAGGAQVAPEAFAARVLAQYPWLSADNAERLQRQSLYFVWKAGGTKPGR